MRSKTFENYHFHWVDYFVFTVMLVLCAAIGAYYGFFKKKPPAENIQSANEAPSTEGDNFGSTSLNEYLLGSRQLKPFPVALSLIASYISGVTILGTPPEIYNYGTQYMLIFVSILLMGLVVAKVYLPVFSTLRLGSSYEYLELRFNPRIRTFGSVMFVIDEILFLPMIVYIPALAFNQVTGANLYLIGGIICIVCVFYTVIGGIKGIVHTDSWQIFVMFLSVIVVTILGTVYIGGPAEVINRASKGGRLIFFNMTPSMYERHSFWSVLIGGFFYWTSFNAVNQTMVQRYMSLPNTKKAELSIAMFTVGIALFVMLCCYAGIIIYAAFHKCDPLTSNLIQATDQLFPLYVMQTVGNLHGIPGLFIAGVFGAALSSLAVVLNSTSAVLLEDILKGCFKMKFTERGASLLVKGSIVFLGALAWALVFVVERLGGVFGVATALSAIAAGSTFGIFTLGMLVPWSNTKGALTGAISGALMSGWITFGSQAATAAGQVLPHKLPLSVEECVANATNFVEIVYPDESNVFPLYRLSFLWINPIGIFTVVVVGTIASFLTGPTKLKSIDPDLISPVIYRILPKEVFPESKESKDAKTAESAKK